MIGLIRLYQITPLASHQHCRFTPTCSNYYIKALKEYGFIKGNILGIKRIMRCNPFNKHYGLDDLK